MLEIKGTKKKQPAYYTIPNRSRQFWRAFTKIILWALGITIVLIIAVFIYAWYISQHSGGNVAVKSIIKPVKKLPSTPKYNPNASVGVATQYISTPIAPGSNATMTIHTNADVNCSITVKYDKVAATDSGLMPKKADDYGFAQWTWTVPATTPETNNGSVDVWCSDPKSTGHVLEPLVIHATP
jgi:hypothetical protein